MLDKAKKLPFKSLHCQNLEESLQVDSATFDAVVCVGVFDFIIRKKAVLNEISRLLKIGGVAGITVPDSASHKGGIEEYLCQANLKVIKSERFFGYRDSTTGEVVNFWGLFLKKI
jgi:ubiquinone/menaquinone biosynthesis C-methylase UbiE